MANDLTQIMPQILARGLLALREAAIMPRLVSNDYGDEAKQKGETIDIPVSRPQTVTDVTPSPTHSSAASNTPTMVQVPLDQWKHTDFYLTDKELVQIDKNRHFLPMQMAEAIKALANTMDVYIHNRYTGIYGYVGTAGVSPFSTIVTATEARRVLNEQLCPIGNRNGVLDPTAEAAALGLTAFADVSQSSDRGPKIEGEIGRKLGFDWFMSQNVVTHTKGTAASVVIGSTTAAGVSTLGLLCQTTASIGTLALGDVFTIAGDSQTYVVQALASLGVANGNVSINPPLQAIASANAVVTIKGSHTVNLAFHPQAFAFGTRPLLEETADLDGGNRMVSATDPITGLSLRLEIIRQNKQNAWDLDVLYGGKLVRAEFATRIAG